MSNPISDIGAAITGGSAISNLLSGATNKGGAGSTFTPPQNVNIPPFYSSGGITPEQESLAQYGMNEADVATGSTFGNSGTGMSTMATQAGTGNRMGKAITEGTTSNTDEDAMYKAYQNEQQAAIQGLTNQSELANLATQAQTFSTQQLTNDITQAGKAATTVAGNSDFSQGASDIFNTTSG